MKCLRAVVVLSLVLAACTIDLSDGALSTRATNPVAAQGTSQRVSIFTHCGFYEAVFDGELWTPENIARGSSPAGTGFNATAGVMTRQGERALFEADSGLEIWFQLAPPDLPPPPGCD